MSRFPRRHVRRSVLALTAIVLAAGAWLRAQRTTRGEDRVMEIRAYTLKPGVRDDFHRRFIQESLPLLQRAHVDVVAYGPSVHDDVSYFLVRSFASLAERTRSEDAFYGSREWTDGPRAAVMAAIDTYSTVVVTISAEALRRFRQAGGTTRGAEEAFMSNANQVQERSTTTTVSHSSDIATLLALNDDYIRAVQDSDPRRFRELLADDFLCSQANGSQIDRDQFLAQVAAPAAISELQAHDVNVRVMGDFALVHARTTFRTPDGRTGQSRYTDTWARRDGRWVAIAAQITRY